MLSMIGLLGGLILLIILMLCGVNLFIVVLICVLLVVFSSGMVIFFVLVDINFINVYMDGFVGFLSVWFFMFLLGLLFGKFMEDIGVVDSVVSYIVGKLGMKYVVFVVVIVCVVLIYGGVSVFIVVFFVYLMVLSLFKDVNLLCCFILVMLVFGLVIFIMILVGLLEI